MGADEMRVSGYGEILPAVKVRLVYLEYCTGGGAGPS